MSDYDFIDRGEGNKVTVYVQIEMDADELWSRVFGAEPFAFGSWWLYAKYRDGAEWDRAGAIDLEIEDPEEGEGSGIGVGKRVDMDVLLDAISKCPPHIVSDLIEDNMDCVSADYILQVAVLGECVYG